MASLSSKELSSSPVKFEEQLRLVERHDQNHLAERRQRSAPRPVHYLAQERSEGGRRAIPERFACRQVQTGGTRMARRPSKVSTSPATRDGSWVWWHENGQKSVSGEFVKGVEIGKWTWWNEDGKVANSARITEGQSTFSAEEGKTAARMISSPRQRRPARGLVLPKTAAAKAATTKPPRRVRPALRNVRRHRRPIRSAAKQDAIVLRPGNGHRRPQPDRALRAFFFWFPCDYLACGYSTCVDESRPSAIW